MSQKIEAPNEDDVDRIARMILYARQLSEELTGQEFDGSLDDLPRLQRILDSGSIQPEATTELQCLGLAFGKVFVENNDGYDWWMAEDEYGRDACVRYGETSLLAFPQTMLSKRVEDGEKFDVADLYHGLVEQIEQIRLMNFND